MSYFPGFPQATLCSTGGSAALEEALGETAALLHDEDARNVGDVLRVVTSNAHWLRNDARLLSPLLYDRLVSMGWSHDELTSWPAFGDQWPAIGPNARDGAPSS